MTVESRTKKPGAEAAGAVKKMVRCAIYTRKSTEEGLSMDFNSLDAQREAAEAFVHSQRHEGWVVLPEKFDDGGFTGGNIDRPALKRLMAEIEAGHVDAVVVYKVDRLSRSLLDFSRLMETFDKYACSFVSVTQQFSTVNSMGRLTLNILLSFSQFEREVIGERTRDKMSAARKKGKWVGGSLILGYDLDRDRRKLVVNEDEAQEVRNIFALYLEKRSVLATVQELNRRGWPRKTWAGKVGQPCGGGAWTKSNLTHLLTNAHYVGKVDYQGEIYEGEHDAIIDGATWAKSQALLTRNRQQVVPTTRNKYGALLRGILKCGTCGCSMNHTYTAKEKIRYRYYVCQNAAKRGYASCDTRSIPAQEIEDFIVDRMAAIGSDEALIAEVEGRARTEREESLAALVSEKTQIEKSLSHQARTVAGIMGQPNASRRLADLNDQIRAGENRMAEIAAEIAGLEDATISREDVASVLGSFRVLFDRLTPAERTRLVSLVVDQISYNGERGTVSISFHPTGIKTIAEENP